MFFVSFDRLPAPLRTYMSRLPNSSRPSRRSFLRNTAIGGAAATFAPLYPALGAARDLSSTASSASPIPEVKAFELDEITISDLQDGMTSGKFTARSLVEKYTARIDELDKRGPAINSIIELNPDALAIADAPDR